MFKEVSLMHKNNMKYVRSPRKGKLKEIQMFSHSLKNLEEMLSRLETYGIHQVADSEVTYMEKGSVIDGHEVGNRYRAILDIQDIEEFKKAFGRAKYGIIKEIE